MPLFKTDPDYSHLPEYPKDKWYCDICNKWFDPEEFTWDGIHRDCGEVGQNESSIQD